MVINPRRTSPIKDVKIDNRVTDGETYDINIFIQYKVWDFKKIQFRSKYTVS